MARLTKRQAELVRAQQEAFRCGYSCFHPEGAVETIRQDFDRGAVDFLTVAERAAYHALMPATWWAAFGRGWSAALLAASQGIVDHG